MQAGNALQQQANRRQDRLNTVMVSDAYAQLQKKSFDRLQVANSLKGREALNVFNDYKKWFDTENRTISKNLQNDRQREIYSFEMARLQESRYGAVSRHQANEEKSYQSSVYNSNMALLMNEYQSQPFDDKALSDGSDRLSILTATMHPGENVEAINMINDQKLQTLRVQSMIDKNPGRAKAYIEKLKPQLGSNYVQLKKQNNAAIDKKLGNDLYNEFKSVNYAIQLNSEEKLANGLEQKTVDPFKIPDWITPEDVPDFNIARTKIEQNKTLSTERKRQVLGWVDQDERKYLQLKNDNEQMVLDSTRDVIGEMLLAGNAQEAQQLVEDSPLPARTRLSLHEFIKAREINTPNIENLVDTMDAIEAGEITKSSEIKSLKAMNLLDSGQETAANQYLEERDSDDKFYIDRALELFDKKFPKNVAESLYKPDFEIWLRKKTLAGVHDIDLYTEAQKYFEGAAADWHLLNPFSWGSGDSEFQKDIKEGEFAAPDISKDITPEIKAKILQDIEDTPGLQATQDVINFVYERKYKGQNDQSD